MTTLELQYYFGLDVIVWIAFEAYTNPELLSGLLAAGIHLFRLDKAKMSLEHLFAEQVGLVRHEVFDHKDGGLGCHRDRRFASAAQLVSELIALESVNGKVLSRSG